MNGILQVCDSEWSGIGPQTTPIPVAKCWDINAQTFEVEESLQGHVTDGEHFGRKMENE